MASVGTHENEAVVFGGLRAVSSRPGEATNVADVVTRDIEEVERAIAKVIKGSEFTDLQIEFILCNFYQLPALVVGLEERALLVRRISWESGGWRPRPKNQVDARGES